MKRASKLLPSFPPALHSNQENQLRCVISHPMDWGQTVNAQGFQQATYSVEGYVVRLAWNCRRVDSIVERLRNPNFLETADPPDLDLKIEKMGEEYGLSINEKAYGTASLDKLPLSLERKIQLEVATYAPNAVFVHSGVVRYHDSLVLIPGKSFSGKSSLVQALCKAGASYYSDEYAVVDSEGMVRPWPRPISLRGRDGTNVRERIDAKDLGWRPEHGPVRPSLVVLTMYREGAEWSPQPVTAGKGVMGLLENTVSAQLEPQRALKYLSKLMDGVECLQSERGDADETATFILDYLSANEAL